MKESQPRLPEIEEIRSSLNTRGFVELPHTPSLDEIVEEILINPQYGSVYGTKRVFELVNDRFPTQEVALVYDKDRLEAVDFPTEGADLDVDDEEQRDGNAREAATLSLLGYPVIFMEKVKEGGKVEKRTVYLSPFDETVPQTA